MSGYRTVDPWIQISSLLLRFLAYEDIVMFIDKKIYCKILWLTMLLVLSYRNLPTFVKSEQSQRCLEESYVSILGMLVYLINLLVSGMMLISL